MSANSLLQGKKLGVLISTPPDHSNFSPALALLNAALNNGIAVYLYCIDEGVHCINTPQIQKLKSSGVNLFGCAYGAQRHNVKVDEAAAYSGLTIVSDLIASTDRFISFH